MEPLGTDGPLAGRSPVGQAGIVVREDRRRCNRSAGTEVAGHEKANEEANYKAKPIRENIAFEDFQKLDIRVGTVLECTKVPKADKLLCFKIADGLENRTIVSGISKFYKPEELVGKQVCFIANLAPRKLKGIESQGMILSALNYDESLSVITVDREVKPGSEVC